MSYDDYRLRMEKLQNLIKRECTGNIDELSYKLGISRRTLFNDISTLRDNGSLIKFSKYRKTYYFDN
jgi:Response regulator consisting of a CheY-like receiver domain and a Fis-type HTH domain